MAIEALQLDLFKTDEYCEVKQEVQKVNDSLNKVRKGTYAKINEQKAVIENLKNRVEIMEKFICTRT